MPGGQTEVTRYAATELEALGDNASGERFQSLYTRFESTLQEAGDAAR
jgi:hypothetical protein